MPDKFIQQGGFEARMCILFTTEIDVYLPQTEQVQVTYANMTIVLEQYSNQWLPVDPVSSGFAMLYPGTSPGQALTYDWQAPFYLPIPAKPMKVMDKIPATIRAMAAPWTTEEVSDSSSRSRMPDMISRARVKPAPAPTAKARHWTKW